MPNNYELTLDYLELSEVVSEAVIKKYPIAEKLIEAIKIDNIVVRNLGKKNIEILKKNFIEEYERQSKNEKPTIEENNQEKNEKDQDRRDNFRKFESSLLKFQNELSVKLTLHLGGNNWKHVLGNTEFYLTPEQARSSMVKEYLANKQISFKG